MSFAVEAVYEDGVLKPTERLPLMEHDRVEITITPKRTWVQETAGIADWKGDPEELRRLALAPDMDLEEAT